MAKVVPISVPFMGWTALNAFLPYFNNVFKQLVQDLGLEVLTEPTVEWGVEFVAVYPAGQDAEFEFSLIVSPLFEVQEGGNTLELVKFRVWAALDNGKEIHEVYLDPHSSSLQEELASFVHSLQLIQLVSELMVSTEALP